MKESIYIDTSVPSAYYDDREPEKKKITRAFWNKLEEYQVFISRITVAVAIPTEFIGEEV